MANVSIDELRLDSSDTPRVTNALKREGIQDARALSGWKEEDLLKIRNIGSNDIRRIKRALRKHNFRLRSK